MDWGVGGNGESAEEMRSSHDCDLQEMVFSINPNPILSLRMLLVLLIVVYGGLQGFGHISPHMNPLFSIAIIEKTWVTMATSLKINKQYVYVNIYMFPWVV